MARRAIAVDLGGTQVRAGVLDEKGTLDFHAALPTQSGGGPQAVLAQIEALVARARAAAPDAGPVIGVVAPGPIDTRLGIACTVQSLPGFDNFPLRDELARRLSATVVLDNDGIAGAMGEWRFGAGRGAVDMLYVTLSTGIGGGIIAGGAPLRGNRGMAGHIGHSFFAADWPRAPGGVMTCFEDYASGTALAFHAVAAVKDHPGSTLAQAAPLDARAVMAAAAAGDALAMELAAEEARIVGTGLASLVHVLSPERIVLGGGLSNALPQLMPGILQALGRNAKPGFETVDVVPAALGGHSCLMGAAAMALDPRLAPFA